MGRFNGILLCSDFDGTLCSGSVISDEDRDAIEYFKSNGGLFTIVSGRFPEFFSEELAAGLPNTYVIGLNGAVIFDLDGKKTLYSEPLPDDALKIARDIYFSDERIIKTGVYDYSGCKYYRRDEWDVCEFPRNIAKMVFLTRREVSDSVYQTVISNVDDRYAVERSWISCIELINSENTKGKGIRRLRKMLGERAKLLIAAGDFENDITMIREADIGYAVGNAIPKLKEVADRVTVSVEEHAIAHIIADLDKEL